MHPAPGYPTYLRVASVALAAILTANCGDATAPMSRETGAIEITVATTTGAEGVIDPDGYYLILDREWQLIAVDAAMTISDVTVGWHMVRLEGMEPHCAVTGFNPVPVKVSSSKSTSVHITVICGGAPGPWDY